MMQEHRQIEKLLAYYRELADEERDFVDKHVAQCASCARQLDDYRQLDQALAQVMEQTPSEEPPQAQREQRAAFYAALDKEKQRGRGFILGQFAGVVQQGASILLLVLLTVALVWMFRGQFLKNNASQTADQSPPQVVQTPLLVRDIIVLGDGQVFDGESGELLHQLPVQRQAGLSYFLAADPARERLFVTDTVIEGQIGVDYLTVYRTSDWSIEWRVPVPDLIRYKLAEDDFSGILPSPDGRYLYVYNYNARTRGDDGAVRYWLTILDLSSGTWLDEAIDLSPECGVSHLFMKQPQRLIVLCHGSMPYVDVIDPITKRVIDRVHVDLSSVSSALLDDETLYLVSRQREIAIRNLADAETSRDLNETVIESSAYVPNMAIGIDSERKHLYVPKGITDSEHNLNLVPEIKVIDLSSGTQIWSHLLKQPIRSLAFAPDGSTAFVLVTGEADMASTPSGQLVRLDLQTGKQTTLYGGHIPAKLLVVPAVKAPRTIEPTPTPLVTPMPTPQEVITATFGSPPLLELKGYDFEWEAEEIRLTYHWEVVRPVTIEYAIFTHLLDAEGRLLAQHDQPLNNEQPSSWQAGSLIMSPVELFLPTLPEGSYTLFMGIYDPTTTKRLTPVRQDGEIQANGVVTLMEIEKSSSSVPASQPSNAIKAEVLQSAYRKGSPDAPVTIIEFSDYQCPSCQNWANVVYPQLQPYIENGSVQFLFIDFPLTSLDSQAAAAAQAAHCAGELGGTDAYWTMHEALFADVSQWSEQNKPAPLFNQLASNAGLDGDAIQECVERDRFRDKVEAGQQEAIRLGLTGIPTFFINGNRLQGAQPFSAFEPYLRLDSPPEPEP